MAFLKKNFAHGTLASTLNAAAVQLTMTAGHSLPTGSEEFRLVIWDAVTYPNPSDDSNVEIVTALFNAGNVYDIIRAEEGTSDVEHASGSKAGLHFTAGVYESDLALVAASFKTFFLSDTGSGVGSLNYAYPHETGEAESTIVSASLGTGDDQLIKGYITEAGEPGTTTIHDGVFPVHLHADKGASNHKTTQLYAVLSSVDADGSSNKTTITTTNISDPLSDTEVSLELHMSLMSDLDVADTARLILDVYANIGTGAVDSVVTLYMEGVHDSHWSTAVNSGLWQTHGDVLDDLNSLGAAASDGQFIVATGAGAFAYESGAIARTSMGVSIGSDVQAFGAVLDDLNLLGVSSDNSVLVGRSGVVAYYKLDDNAADTVVANVGGNEVAATLGGGDNTSVKNIAGLVDDAFDMNGTDDYVDTNDPQQTMLRGSFSMVFAIKPDDGHPATTSMIVGARDVTGATSAMNFQLRTDGTLLFSYVSEGNSGAAAQTDDPVFADGAAAGWTIIGIVADASIGGVGGKKIYVNGVEAVLSVGANGNTTGVTFSEYTTVQDLLIAAWNDAGVFENFFAGGIDNVIFYDHALTAADMLTLYSGGAGTTDPHTGTLAWSTDPTLASLNVLNSVSAGTIELGHASDTTLVRASAGDVNIEGNIIYRADGTNVPIADGGTGQSTAQFAINALSAVSTATNEHVLTKDTGSGNAVWKVAAGSGDNDKVGVDIGATPDFLGAAAGGGALRVTSELSYADGGDFVTLGLNIGQWTTPSFSAGDFTQDSGTWTVEAGDVTTYSYMIIGKTMFVNWNIETTTIASTPLRLRIAIPASKTSANSVITSGINSNAGAGNIAHLITIATSGTYLSLFVAYGTGNWVDGTNNTTVNGSIFFEID